MTEQVELRYASSVGVARPRDEAARRALAALREAHWPALALFVIVTLVMTIPYPRQIATSLYNWSDSLLNTWTLAWGVHALLTDPLNLYNANIFYPYPNSLAYSESLLPQTAQALPIILATNLPSLAHNLLMLSSFVLAGFGMYLLAFDLTRSRGAGLVAGMIYTFTSYKMIHIAHLQLLSSQWLPFALLYLHKLLNGTRAAPSAPPARLWRAALLFALFFSLQALSSFYYAFFVAVAAALYGLYQLAIHLWRQQLLAWLAPRLGPSLAALFLIALLTIPLSLPYFQVQRELGLQRDTRDVEYYAATVRTYFSVPEGNWLYGGWLSPAARLTGSGERDFVGFVAVALAIIGLVAGSRAQGEKWFYVLLALVAVVLSFGASNQILFFPRWPKLVLPFYLPFRWLFEWVPGFRAMRGPDRFAYLAILGIAVLAAFGTVWVVKRLRSRPALAVAAPLLLAGLIGLENLTIPIRATNPATLARPAPAFATFLSRTPADAVVLELPMIYERESLTWPQYYSIYHWHQLVNGFSGFFPPGYGALADSTRSFPSNESLALLDEIGVQLVVVHNDLLTLAERAALESRLSQFQGRVRPVFQSGTDVIYQLNSAEQGWGAALASVIATGARVELRNDRAARREFVEIAAAFLKGRVLTGNEQAAFRALAPVGNSTPDFVLTNAEAPAPAGYTRRLWSNDYLAVYGQ